MKDILAYLRVIDSPRDEVSLLRIINNPPRGIGEKTVETLLKEAVTGGKPIWDVMTDRGRHAAAHAAERPSEAVGAVRRRSIERYHAELQQGEVARRCGPPADRRDRLRGGAQAALSRPERAAGPLGGGRGSGQRARRLTRKGAKKPTLGGFIDEVTLGQQDMGDDKEKQLAKNAVALMTLHSAKGLEFPHVYMVGMEEGILPHHRSLKVDSNDVEEERRLCYVGVTRAQERLTLSLSLTRLKWGKPRDTIPSRFLYEIMGQAEKANTTHRPKGHRPMISGAMKRIRLNEP